MLLQKLTGLIPKKEYADLYAHIVNENFSKENRRLSTRKMKALTSIELFTDRIAKAKNLLLDNHIDFESYSEIKSDLEAKIQVLGYTVQAYSQKQIDLTDKIKGSACLISDPKKLFQALDEINRPSLLNRILVRSQNWEQGNSNHIFHESFRAIYALEEEGKDAKISEVDIRATLETMANLELLVGK